MFLAGLLTSGTLYAGTLRAAAVEVDITPSTPQWLTGYRARQSTGVHDRIYHRIAVLNDGHTAVYFISTDTCLMSPAYVEKVKQDIRQQLGIAPENIWWLATHTHSAPEIGPPGAGVAYLPDRYAQASAGESNPDYTEFAERKLIEGLRQAREQLQPARLGLGTGFSAANINRRAIAEDGTVTLGLNPDGPTDRQIGLIRLETVDGKLIALLANFAIHGTVLGQENLEISADAPGVVEQYVEKKLGAPVLFMNGAEGNLAPIYSVYPDFKSGHLDQFQVLLGDRILEANRRIRAMTADVSLAESQITVETPLRAGLKWPDALKAYVHSSTDGAAQLRVPVYFLEVNHDAVLWGAPVELFCEIAMDVRQQSRFPFTFYFGLLNGWLGYFPTAEAVRQGGYEPATSPVTDRGESDLRQAVMTQIAGMPR